MIGLIDKQIEIILSRSLRKKRDKLIRQTMATYQAHYEASEETLAELEEHLSSQADKLYTAMDRSIIHASILRARYTFWITAAIGSGIVIALAVFPITTSIAPFFVPLMAAFVAWAITVGTIPIGYIQNIKSTMDTMARDFEKGRQKASTKGEIEELKNTILELQEQVSELSVQFNRQDTEPVATSNSPMAFWNERTTEIEMMENRSEQSSKLRLDR